MASEVFVLSNPVFRSFLGYAAVVLVKTMLMSALTAFHRITKKAFANEEDTKISKAKKIVTNEPSVERVRRAHLNDQENIFPFVLLGFLYVASGPTLSGALMHFRVFTAARLVHTLVYVGQVPQPARMLAFFAGFGVNFSMAYQIIMAAAF